MKYAVGRGCEKYSQNCSLSTSYIMHTSIWYLFSTFSHEQHALISFQINELQKTHESSIPKVGHMTPIKCHMTNLIAISTGYRIHFAKQEEREKNLYDEKIMKMHSITLTSLYSVSCGYFAKYCEPGNSLSHFLRKI